MADTSTPRVCKGKDCGKVLPEGYKHNYCEACRNKRAHLIKKCGGCVLAAALVVLPFIKHR